MQQNEILAASSMMGTASTGAMIYFIARTCMHTRCSAARVQRPSHITKFKTQIEPKHYGLLSDRNMGNFDKATFNFFSVSQTNIHKSMK